MGYHWAVAKLLVLKTTGSFLVRKVIDVLAVTCMCIYIYWHIHFDLHVCTFETSKHAAICIHAHVCIYIYVLIYICMYIWCSYIYI